ncbi:hypothetical protein NRK68_21405 [Streptomyces yangpuensis]|uniref:DUF397 domain-containing protein n=1 Tax=Streptomyces yangpuensis TaxID=1648182 RepID=A0ABY5Q1K0_9ACTN|nr:hypothetical protein [Streptomyces yangpuensis]UUY49548.1 hypothetical protein NRK68_21405 [Streptomyces yangpuensis]
MTMKSAGDRPQEGPSPELLARADAGWERFLRAAHGQAAPSDG